MKKFIFTISIGAILFSCGDQPQTENNNHSEESSDQDTTESVMVWDQNDYENDWIEIRESILAADTSILAAFIQAPHIEAGSVISIFEDERFRDELIEKPYGELSEVDYNGDLVKEFSAEYIVQKDGQDIEHDIILFFKETKDDLRLIDWLVTE